MLSTRAGGDHSRYRAGAQLTLLTWPDSWQAEATRALEPFVDAGDRVDILVGDPQTSISGTRLAGHLYRGDGGRVMIRYDRSRRPDVHPWALLGGPVLVAKLLRPRRRALELYRHPDWNRD